MVFFWKNAGFFLIMQTLFLIVKTLNELAKLIKIKETTQSSSNTKREDVLEWMIPGILYFMKQGKVIQTIKNENPIEEGVHFETGITRLFYYEVYYKININSLD